MKAMVKLIKRDTKAKGKYGVVRNANKSKKQKQRSAINGGMF